MCSCTGTGTGTASSALLAMRKIEEVLIVVYFLRGVVLSVVEAMMWMRDKAEIYELSSSCRVTCV